MTGWNHNIHYHPLVLAAVPRPCGRALDVGCGQGLLTRQLAPVCAETIGVDLDTSALESARSGGTPGRLEFVAGDVMTYPFAPASFDFLSAVATLHHLPLQPALSHFDSLLRPGGVLAILGLYRAAGLSDHAFAVVGASASWMMRRTRKAAAQTAPMQAPQETLAEIRAAAGRHLPGAVVQRRLFFRYSLIWQKPARG